MIASTLFLCLFSYQNYGLDAMVTWRSGKAYAFSGGYYFRYDLNKNAMDPGYPRPIAGNWTGLPFSRIDAAVNWQNGKAFFFSGNQYVRYDIATDRADPGYPKAIQTGWKLPWSQVDAALYWNSNKVYFFNNASGTFVRYDVATNLPDPGYPKYTSSSWQGFPFPWVDAATSYGGRGYFVKGNQFSRALIPNGNPEGGYPKGINYLPDCAGNASAYGTMPPSTNAPPPSYTPPPSPPAQVQQNNCTINGTLAYIRKDGYGQASYQQWNDVKVELHQANQYYNGRYNQLVGAGYNHQQAMSQCLKEDNLWVAATSSITKPCQMVSNKYGWQYSWFGFVNLRPTVYRVVVPGYPQMNRWVQFTAGGQKIAVALEYP